MPLKWADDAATGAGRYIHDDEVADGRAACTCRACGLPLTAVLADQPRRRKPTPHFRHPKGAQKDDCIIVAARLAVVRHLQETGVIELPRRKMSSTASGFTGEGYEGWAERPGHRAVIRQAVLHDYATALLTLDDGRELLVDLTGTRDVGDDGRGRAVVTMSLSDPVLAMMTKEEIRARLRLLPAINWCAHWEDAALRREAVAQAGQVAREAMDAWSAEDEAAFMQEVPEDSDPDQVQRWRRETVLHREVKAILEQASHLAIPGLLVECVREAPEEFQGEWQENTLRVCWMGLQTVLALAQVRLERRQGQIVPDVTCTLQEPRPWIRGYTDTQLDEVYESSLEDDRGRMRWPETLLVEVTVTHGIGEEKRGRIEALNQPTLEIDFASLGGRVTRDGLRRRLVVVDLVGKRWIHHPVWTPIRAALEAEIDSHPVTLEFKRRLAELRKPRLLATPAKDWAEAYLAAVTDFHDTNVRIQHQRKTVREGDARPEFLGPTSEQWKRMLGAAEALEVHDFPGAAAPEMPRQAGIISRLLSIKLNRGVGYDMGTAFQVLSAIMQSGPDYQLWHTVYAIAVKAYGLEAQFTPKQAARYASWKEGIIEKVKAGDATHLRPGHLDAVLSVLFPELAAGLANGFGRTK